MKPPGSRAALTFDAKTGEMLSLLLFLKCFEHQRTKRSRGLFLRQSLCMMDRIQQQRDMESESTKQTLAHAQSRSSSVAHSPQRLKRMALTSMKQVHLSLAGLCSSRSCHTFTVSDLLAKEM